MKYGVSVLLTVVFLYLAFRGTDFARLYTSVRDANYAWMLLSFAILMVSHVVRSWRWRYLLEPMKPGIPLRNLFSAVMVGYLLNNVLPRAGEVARPYTIGKLESISKSAAFGTIVVERIMDTVSFLVVIILVPLVYNGPLKESFPWLAETGIIISCVTGAAVLLLVVLMFRRDWTDALLRVVSKVLPENIMRRVQRQVHSFLDGFLFLKNPSNFLIITVLSVIVWALYILMTYVAFFAFDLQGALGLRAALVVQAISSIGVAIPTPGATGSYHVFTSQTLSKLFSVDATVALSFATVTHAVGFIGVTLIGLYYFIRDHITVSEAVRREELRRT